MSFTQEYISENGISPTIDELRKKLKLKALSTVHEHINALKTKGYISKDANSARGMVLEAEFSGVFQIPIKGMIAAGQALEAVESDLGSVSVTSQFIKNPKDHYALKVVGDSMVEDGIFNGDIVVIKKQSVAENGQTVVAVIDDNEATLKRLYRENGRFRLQPRNQNLLPFYRNEVEVRGVVVQIISNPQNIPELQSNTKINQKFRTVDLFAGVGGIRLGFEKAGFKTVFSNDFELRCKETYDLNFRDSKLVVEDIRKIGIDDLPNFDFLLGGFPCQAFSIAGYRQGFKDEKGRGNLFFDIARINRFR